MKETTPTKLKEKPAKHLAKKIRLEDLELALGEDSGSDKNYSSSDEVRAFVMFLFNEKQKQILLLAVFI